jgi:hypothetical protein
MSRLVLSYRDFSRETSSIELLIAEPSAGGADFDAVLSDAADLVAAIDDITVCTKAREYLAINESKEVGDPSAGAKRELGLRVFWADTTAETVGHFTIPGPDPTGAWLQVGTDEVDATDADIAALIVAVEANVYSPDGNLVNVSRIVEVGRRN